MKSKILLTLATLLMMTTLSSCVTVEFYNYDEKGNIINDEKAKGEEMVKQAIPVAVAETNQETDRVDESDLPSIHPFAFARPLSWVVLGPIVSFVPAHGTYPVVTPVLMMTLGVPTFLGLTVFDLATLGYFENPITVKEPNEGSKDKSDSSDKPDESTYEYNSLSDMVEENLMQTILFRPGYEY